MISTLKLSWKHEIRDMWEKSMKGLLGLVKRTTPSSFTYICEKNGNSLNDKVRCSCYTCISLHLGSLSGDGSMVIYIVSFPEALLSIFPFCI